ncbi:hypothetical protein ACFIOY_38130 [Bradyrhizobium sp. TZ2]
MRANDLSETVKLVVLLGQYMQDNYQGRYYAKAKTARACYAPPTMRRSKTSISCSCRSYL